MLYVSSCKVLKQKKYSGPYPYETYTRFMKVQIWRRPLPRCLRLVIGLKPFFHQAQHLAVASFRCKHACWPVVLNAVKKSENNSNLQVESGNVRSGFQFNSWVGLRRRLWRQLRYYSQSRSRSLLRSHNPYTRPVVVTRPAH